MNNIMVDLETLGNGSNAVIIAIGAVQFDETGLGRTFYTTVDAQSCVDIGLRMDVSTVMWWMKQSNEARAAFDLPGERINNALHYFSAYIAETAGDKAEVWGNGATFDNVILANAYEEAGMKKPWKYWADRCYRTMKNMYPQITAEDVGTAHNALDDAMYQALHMVKILTHIKGETDER